MPNLDRYIYLNNRDVDPEERSIFKTTLTNPIDLAEGETAKIAIKEICLPNNWYNIESGTTVTVYDAPDRLEEISVDITPGYYADYKRFAAHVQKMLQEVEKTKNVNNVRAAKIVDFSRVDGANRPYMLLTLGFGVELSESLRLKLGLAYSIYENETSDDNEDDEDVRLYFPEMDLHRNHHSCIITCPMIRPVIYQNTSQHVLRIIPSRMEKEAKMIYETFDPIYHEITSNRIYDIEVAVMGQNYKPLELSTGEAFILLHLTFT